tara:strand:- start:210 stop:686 length:477 start_codon:yes stop_codon:yes gene_type:complete
MNNITEPDARPFTNEETRTFLALVDMIIPASDEYTMPDASDTTIFNSIIANSAKNHQQILEALSALETLAQKRESASFADLLVDQRERIVKIFRETYPAEASMIENLTSQCYYQDDRIMISLGMEPRPPHPKGFTVEQGDWSLLEPVRKREKFYRKPK